MLERKPTSFFSVAKFGRAAVAVAASIGACLATSTSALAVGGSPAPSSGPHTFYVSRAASPFQNDGSSWAHAWRELNAINWNAVNPGDTIEIDGGRFSMSYRTTLNVGKDGASGNPITIVSASDPDRNGQVIIDGINYSGPPAAFGIVVGNHHDVTIQGRTWQAISVVRHPLDGVVTGPSSTNVTLKNLDIHNNGTQNPNACGLRLGGLWNNCNQLTIHDNPLNVDINAPVGGYAPTLRRCWIGNLQQHATGGDGIHIDQAYVGGFSWYYVFNSVIGPGLKRGIVFAQPNSGLFCSNTLFVNPGTTNIVKTATTPPNSYYTLVFTNNCTSFLTALNSTGQSHDCLTYVEGQDGAYNNVFYGGNVNITGTRTLGSGNFQFKTTGNTNVISPTEIDPRFADPTIATFNGNTPLQTLFNTDFSLSPSSPASGKGSSITSVGQLMSTDQ